MCESGQKRLKLDTLSVCVCVCENKPVSGARESPVLCEKIAIVCDESWCVCPIGVAPRGIAISAHWLADVIHFDLSPFVMTTGTCSGAMRVNVSCRPVQKGMQ